MNIHHIGSSWIMFVVCCNITMLFMWFSCKLVCILIIKKSLLCTNVSCYISSNYFPNWKHLLTCIHLYIKWQMLLSYTLFVRFLPKFLLNINCHKDKNSTETNYSCIFGRKEWNEGNQQSFCLFKIILDSYWFITAITLLLFM